MEVDADVLRRIIAKWGAPSQIHKIQEEALELALAINQRQCVTKDPEAMDAALYDELADMKIMMAQAHLLFDAKRINERVAFKIYRVQKKHLDPSPPKTDTQDGG